LKQQQLFLGPNIKVLRERMKLSQENFARSLGITRSKLALLESGHTKSPPLGDIVNFSTIFKVSVDTLLKIDLTRLSDQQIHELETGNDIYSSGKNLRVLATTVDKNNNEQIELVPEKAIAGYKKGYSDPEWIADLPRYSIPGLSKHKKYRIFPTNGDSMIPYPSGCYIIAEYVEDWINLKNETLCILILNGTGAEILFKQVENRILKDKKIVAKSLNLLYQPFEIPISEVIEIWKYKAHLSETIVSQSTNASPEQLFRMVQQIRLDIDHINKKLAN